MIDRVGRNGSGEIEEGWKVCRLSLDEQELGSVDCEMAELGSSESDAMVITEIEEVRTPAPACGHCKLST